MPRRAVIVRAHPSVVEGMMFASFPGNWWRTDRGLPEGAKCVGRGYDWERNTFWFAFEHESFDEVPDGEMTPEFRGVDFSTIHFSNPAGANEVSLLDTLTAEQVARGQAQIDALAVKVEDWCANKSAPSTLKVVPEKLLKFAAENLSPPDDAQPTVVGG